MNAKELYIYEYCRKCPLYGGCRVENAMEKCHAIIILENRIKACNEFIRGDIAALNWLKTVFDSTKITDRVLKEELERIINDWEKALKDFLKCWKVPRK